MAGFSNRGDSGVFLISNNLAIVQSVDVFTPIVDDAYMFGRIAAVNAMSDIYAVGAKPVCALNILMFPCALVDEAAATMQGGADAVREAGSVILGGHSVDDPIPKYGLAVTGVMRKKELVSHQGARPGDTLILTKKIGTGLITSAHRSGGSAMAGVRGWKKKLSASHREVVESMARPNMAASQSMVKTKVNACTDITGFGLLGHARNMAEQSGACLVISASAVPRFDGALELAAAGPPGGGMTRNMKWIKPNFKKDNYTPPGSAEMLCDPQTSGGLLISVSAKKAEALVDRLREVGDIASAIIGHVESPGGPCVRLVP